MPVCYLKQKRMINKQLITRRFSRAVESYNREAVVQKQIAYRMSDMLNHYLPRPCGRILEIGSGTGFLTRRLMETLHPEKLVLNDICQEICWEAGRLPFWQGMPSPFLFQKDRI